MPKYRPFSRPSGKKQLVQNFWVAFIDNATEVNNILQLKTFQKIFDLRVEQGTVDKSSIVNKTLMQKRRYLNLLLIY